MNKLATNIGGAIGSRYLKSLNQLAFVEYAGFISKINLSPTSTIVSQGTVVIKGTYLFDCETGAISGANTAADIFWE